jgi:hypothetical protein
MTAAIRHCAGGASVKHFLWLAMFITTTLLVASTSAAAQSCQMYSYSDMWLDDDGNAVAVNYTDANTSCGDYTAYADVAVTMPSGYSQFGSAMGTCCAEAISSASTSGEEGDGFINGNNEVDYSCGSLLGSMNSPILIAIKTTYGENTLGSQVIGNSRFCGYTPNCTNNVTPACGLPSWTDVRPAYLACSTFIRSSFIAVRFGENAPYHCKGISFDSSTAGPCDP